MSDPLDPVWAEAEIARLEAKIAALTAELDTERCLHAQAKTSWHDWKREAERLELEAAAANDEVAALTKERDRARLTADELLVRLNTSEADRARIQTGYDMAWRDQFDRVQAEADALRAALRDLIDYTTQIERLVYPADEEGIDHKIVAACRRALALSVGAPSPLRVCNDCGSYDIRDYEENRHG